MAEAGCCGVNGLLAIVKARETGAEQAPERAVRPGVVRDLSSVCVAVAVHASALIGAYLSSPSLVAAEPLAPEPGRTRLVLPPRADEDIALVRERARIDEALDQLEHMLERLCDALRQLPAG